MLHALSTLALPLFVPADRPERYAKALAAGADAVIVDLEDAVAPLAKPAARQALRDARDTLAAATGPVLLRINARGTPHHEADIAA
ncbi:aldolase/citrate lyase family protein, partial [Lichenihabitans sp. Uapishka_5]|uniref:aldolase/citrate lyase family protein n=1 Tax=Lichenihabitans sp. Uapishka_5 TaxID=3037302 RepID=UPI0029E7F7CA